MKVGHETPINGTAARVMAPGESHVFRLSEGAADSSTPLPVRPASHHELAQTSFMDLKGKAFGRLTVAGLSADVKARWVCRCVCGQYVMRTAKTVRGASEEACCDQCRLLACSKQREYVRRTGKHKGIGEFLA